ncbi:hypothetical protein QCB44_04525 [Thiomicrorhabdus sp. zzn3]|uniref:hypothetical protein n=1 Tax=Thiomicrorhabdus sp. zzn3 TaxID=3039775 RepID=UPI00243739A5|nr:hypothetical protein [Thiomicrorhabdus sp. zzn3]MDG6777969.1 hypothetical protein [Thiomicrorhabdus sp. zzn3]
MVESDLPPTLQYLLIALQLVAVGVFLYFIWPQIKGERWKAKFVENKQALSILVVFVLILLFVLGLSSFFDAFFPVERIDGPKPPSIP